MPKKLDLTNQRFGKLIALYPTEQRKRGNIVWACQCDCGKIHYVPAQMLKNGTIQSCGCSRIGNGLIDLTNQKFGKLTVLELVPNKRKWRSSVWKCKCDCGNICEVDSHSLRKGDTSSCGCLKSKGEEKIIQLLHNLNLDFEYQKTFETCKLDFPLKYDFFIPSLQLIIEYDGEQHFKPIKGFGGEKRFKEQQSYDNFKNDWCKNNHIAILRIPYYDFEKLNENFLLQSIQKVKESIEEL